MWGMYTYIILYIFFYSSVFFAKALLPSGLNALSAMISTMRKMRRNQKRPCGKRKAKKQKKNRPTVRKIYTYYFARQYLGGKWVAGLCSAVNAQRIFHTGALAIL